MALEFPGAEDHPVWLTAAATLVSYGIILVAMFVLLFYVPYLLFGSF